MRLDGSSEGGVSRSESVSDLNKELRGELSRPRKSLPDASDIPSKQFAIGENCFWTKLNCIEVKYLFIVPVPDLSLSCFFFIWKQQCFQ